jgi:hypothetical protein
VRLWFRNQGGKCERLSNHGLSFRILYISFIQCEPSSSPHLPRYPLFRFRLATNRRTVPFGIFKSVPFMVSGGGAPRNINLLQWYKTMEQAAGWCI